MISQVLSDPTLQTKACFEKLTLLKNGAFSVVVKSILSISLVALNFEILVVGVLVSGEYSFSSKTNPPNTNIDTLAPDLNNTLLAVSSSSIVSILTEFVNKSLGVPVGISNAEPLFSSNSDLLNEGLGLNSIGSLSNMSSSNTCFLVF